MDLWLNIAPCIYIIVSESLSKHFRFRTGDSESNKRRMNRSKKKKKKKREAKKMLFELYDIHFNNLAVKNKILLFKSSTLEHTLAKRIS